MDTRPPQEKAGVPSAFQTILGIPSSKGPNPATSFANQRDADRATDRSRSQRQRKSNARRQKMIRDRQVSLETLQAQIRVASGETGASPALVANARKALESQVAAVQAEQPDLTNEQAAEVVYDRARGAL